MNFSQKYIHNLPLYFELEMAIIQFNDNVLELISRSLLYPTHLPQSYSIMKLFIENMFSLAIDQIKFWGNLELNFWRIFS
jgi:hypothetical protein